MISLKEQSTQVCVKLLALHEVKYSGKPSCACYENSMRWVHFVGIKAGEPITSAPAQTAADSAGKAVSQSAEGIYNCFCKLFISLSFAKTAING